MSINTIKPSVCGTYIRVIWNVRLWGLAAAYRNCASSATSVSRIEAHWCTIFARNTVNWF